LTSIIYFITGHGYGHAVRSSQVIRALLETRRDVKVHVRTTAPHWLFPRSALYSRSAIDVGLVQQDSLAMDLRATAAACRALLENAPSMVEQECAFADAHSARLIAGDIPALAFAVAARAGLPCAAVTNFTWSGIYNAYVQECPEFRPVIDKMTRAYAQATLALALPYSFDLDVFPRVEEIPWIARQSSLGKITARRRFGIPTDRTVVLLSFGGLGVARLPWSRLERLRKYFFVATGETRTHDGNLLVLPDAQRRYHDLLRAVDAIVTKPGYGIVADAIAHRVPVLYTERGEFPEYRHLVRALHECATAEFIPQNELFAGNLDSFLMRLLEKQPHWPEVELNGAEVAAEKLVALMESCK
jgi:L-arabinokinase